MAIVSAADYAASEGAKKAYADAMAYQAANPSTSSSQGQANDPGSAAYRPSTSSTSQVGGSGGMRNGVSTTAYSDWRTKNWNEMSNDQRNAWDKNGRNFSELDDPGYLSRINAPATPAAVQVQQQPEQKIPATAAATTPQNGTFVPTGGNMNNSYGVGAFESNQFSNSSANPATGATNAQALIDQAIAAQKSATIAALGKSRDNALSNLSAEKSTIQPKYTDAKNQMSAGAQQSAKNFAEFMANRGGASSGANAQAQLMQNQTTQGGLSDLGRQEAAAYTDIARRSTDVGNAYESDVASSDAGAEANKMKLLLQDFYTAQQRGDTQKQQDIQNKIAQAQLMLQRAGLTGNLDGQQTLAGRQTDASIAAQQAGLTGYLPNGQPTLAGRKTDEDIAASKAALTGNYTDPQTLAIQKQMAANSAAYPNATPQERIRLHQENLALGAKIGLTDTTGNGDYSGNTSTRTIAGQQLDSSLEIAKRNQSLQETQIMATLTGKMPDGTPTNTAQQQQLQNLWTASEQSGIIRDELADLYGIPRGTPTQAAKTQAAQIAISRQSAANGAASTARSASNAEAAQALAQAKFDYDKDPTNPDNILKLANAKKAADGPAKEYNYKTDPDFMSDSAGMMANPLAAAKALKANASAYIQKYGMDGYNYLLGLVQK